MDEYGEKFVELILKSASGVLESQYKLLQTSYEMARFQGSMEVTPIFAVNPNSNDKQNPKNPMGGRQGFQPTVNQYLDTPIEIKGWDRVNKDSEGMEFEGEFFKKVSSQEESTLLKTNLRPCKANVFLDKVLAMKRQSEKQKMSRQLIGGETILDKNNPKED